MRVGWRPASPCSPVGALRRVWPGLAGSGYWRRVAGFACGGVAGGHEDGREFGGVLWEVEESGYGEVGLGVEEEALDVDAFVVGGAGDAGVEWRVLGPRTAEEGDHAGADFLLAGDRLLFGVDLRDGGAADGGLLGGEGV